jgi:hypothetical protein
MRKLKLIVSWLCLLYLTLYIPFAFMVYFSPWYRLNCHLHYLSKRITPEKVNIFIKELTGFFLHRMNLETHWTDKEKFHLDEVRGIFDFLAGTAVLSLLLFGLLFDKKYIRKFAGINILVILLLIMIVPFFSYFWVSILHPLLFNNFAWKTNPRDVSYYLLPRAFFKYSMAFLIIFSLIENSALWFWFKKKK